MKIWRKGATVKQWLPVPSKGKLSFRPGVCFALKFWMPSKGGGITDVMVRHYPDDFGSLIRAMGDTNDAETLRAVGEWLVARAARLAAKASNAQPPVVGFQLSSPSPVQQSEAVPA